MSNSDLRVPVGGFRICVNERANNLTGTFINGEVSRKHRKSCEDQFFIELYKSVDCVPSSSFACMNGYVEPVRDKDREQFLNACSNIVYLFKVSLDVYNLDGDYAVNLMNSLKGLLKTAEAGIGRYFTKSMFSVLVSMSTEDVALMREYYTKLKKFVLVDVFFGEDYMLIE